MGPKWFLTVQIIVVEYQLFWTGPIYIGRVQIVSDRFKLDFSGLTFIIWTYPKLFQPNQNELDLSKTIGTWPK